MDTESVLRFLSYTEGMIISHQPRSKYQTKIPENTDKYSLATTLYIIWKGLKALGKQSQHR